MNVSRVTDFGGRVATLLEHEGIRIVIDDKGGMVPELSYPSGNGWFNTHWLPYFRTNSGRRYDSGRDGEVWPVELLYELAGNFPCIPNFGGPSTAYGIDLPPHGISANATWSADAWGTHDDRVAYLRSSLEPSDEYPSIPLRLTKTDMVADGIPGHLVHLNVKNTGTSSYRSNLAWHNTIGPPFLSPGCLIDLSADTFATLPPPSEFDTTARLVAGTEFDSLTAAPLASGGTVDLRVVPGMIGWTDFVTGALPSNAVVGWSAVTNPQVGALYLSVFRGPAAIGAREIGLRFNDLWMQFGGRSYTPWGAQTGGTDYTYCLGAENAICAYANGLGYSLEHDELLGHPTTFEVAPGETVETVYATFAIPYDDSVLDLGVDRVEAGSRTIDIVPRSGGTKISIDLAPDLGELSRTAGEIE